MKEISWYQEYLHDTADETHTNCTVSVLLNDIKPYQNAPATGQRGTNDFSSWQNTITPKYAVLKRDQNKITSKISRRKPY